MRKLDFIVLGVARSGTTAVARYLSASSEIHCAHEVIGYNEDHSALSAPEVFLSRPPKPALNSHHDIQRKEKSILAYGNKHPFYAFRLKGVIAELGNPKVIICWRDLAEVMQSYNLRADNTADPSWPVGRRGLFAAADFLILINSIVECCDYDMIIAPHRALARDWEQTTRAIGTYLTPGTALNFEPAAITELESHKAARAALPRQALSNHEMAILEDIDGSGIPELLDRPEPFLLSNISSEVIRRAGMLSRLDSVLSAIPKSKAIARYLPLWSRHLTASL